MSNGVLAVDIGTTSAKAALVADGAVMGAVASRSIDTASPEPGQVEQDPRQWWSAARDVIAEVTARGVAPVALSVTGQMQDLVPLDARGDAVGPALLYADGRADVEHAALIAQLGGDWADAVGVQPDATNVAAKWQWLRRHRPETAAATHTVLVGAHSFVVRQLTGLAAADHSSAATTGLYDLGAGAWWQPAVAATGIPLPPLVGVDQPVGQVTGSLAAELGLPAGLPVFHANGDAAATTIGLLGDATGPFYAALSTSCWVAGAARRPPRVPGVIVLPGLGPEHFIVTSQMPVAGAAIDWARSQLLGSVDVATFDEMAASTSAAADGVLFLPHLDGSRIPDPSPQAAGLLVGVRRSTTAATIAAAVVEGVAHAVTQLLDTAAPDCRELIVCGGAARSRALCQALADVGDRPVHRRADDAAALIGAAWVAARACGLAAGTAAEAGHVGDGGDGGTFMPRPDVAAVHARLTSTFRALVPTMQPVWTALADVRRT